ncbi:MAG: MFS transporter, partial [Anaerolineae bacterium]
MSVASSFEREVAHHLRHNLTFNIIDGTVWLFGISFVSTATILPVYVSHLTSSALLIGLIPALESLGWYLPQLVTAPFVEGLKRVRPVLLAVSFFERVPFLLIGLVIWLFPARAGDSSNLPLILFFLILGFRMFMSGISAIPWQEMIARVIPTRGRGRFFAAQRIGGGIAGLVGAAAAGEMLSQFAYPLNYALCFVCAFGSAMVSWVCLSQTREPVQHDTRPRPPFTRYLRDLPALLREDRNFTLYLAARAFGFLGQMATAFFAVHAVETFHLADAQAAVYSAILLGTSIVGSAVWGWLGDKRGQKLVLVVSSWFYVLALGLAWFSDTVEAYYAVFVLVGIANAGWILSDLALVMEFAPAARRPTYMGVARGILAPWVGLAPLLGGLLIGLAGYPAMIVISVALTLAGVLLVSILVREPRWDPQK